MKTEQRECFAEKAGDFDGKKYRTENQLSSFINRLNRIEMRLRQALNETLIPQHKIFFT